MKPTLNLIVQFLLRVHAKIVTYKMRSVFFNLDESFIDTSTRKSKCAQKIILAWIRSSKAYAYHECNSSLLRNLDHRAGCANHLSEFLEYGKHVWITVREECGKTVPPARVLHVPSHETSSTFGASPEWLCDIDWHEQDSCVDRFHCCGMPRVVRNAQHPLPGKFH